MKQYHPDILATYQTDKRKVFPASKPKFKIKD
jgi:hypothetical protein